ncbi:MAG: TonB-dependent receptor [Alistipes senegalensis]
MQQRRPIFGLEAQVNPNKRVTLDFNIRYSRMKRCAVRAPTGSTTGFKTYKAHGPSEKRMLYTPIPLKAEIEGGDDLEENSSDAVMPTVATSGPDRKRERTNWTATSSFTWNDVDDLDLMIEAGVEKYLVRRPTPSTASPPTIRRTGGSGSTNPNPSTNYNDVTRRRVRNTNTLSYDFRKLISNDNHHLNVLLGQEYIITEQRTFNTVGRWSARLLRRRAGVGLHGCGLQRQLFEHELCGQRHPALLFRTHQLRFQGQVHAFGHDARRRFVEPTKGQKWGYFPSVAASWRLWTSGGWRTTPVARQPQAALQLRYRGQQQHPDRHGRPLTQLYEVGTGSSFIYGDPTYWTPNGNGASESFMANANLTWETTYSHNLGLDFGFWRNRLSGSVEVYQNTTEDILMRYPVSGSGYSFQYRNAGTIRNRGLEVSVSAVLLEKAKYGLNLQCQHRLQPQPHHRSWPD